MDEWRWSIYVKADTVEDQQGRGRPKFGWLDVVKKSSSCQGGRLAGGNAICENEEFVERTCEDVIVLTLSEEIYDDHFVIFMHIGFISIISSYISVTMLNHQQKL